MPKSDFNKLQSNFIEIALRHGCSPVKQLIGIALWHGCSPINLLHIFRTPFPRNTASGRLLLIYSTNFSQLLVRKS